MSLQKKVIIFNGPPYSGKDMGANVVLSTIALEGKWMTARHNKFSESMKKAVHALYGIFESPEQIEKEGRKDKPHTDIFKRTPRWAYIKMWEFLSSLHGEDVLGQLMEHQMRRQPQVDVHVFSDGGRAAEVAHIINYVGAKNICVIEVHATDAEGPLSWEEDIRGFIADSLKHAHPKITVFKIPNEHSADPTDLELYKGLVKGAVKKFLGI